MFSGNNDVQYNTYKFILDVLDGMSDWVRVVDDNYSVVFMNRAMEEGLQDQDFVGKKCYEQLNKDFSCKVCTCKQAIKYNRACKKVESIGDKIYSVMSSPIANEESENKYCVEVIRDITKDKKMERQIIAQNEQLKNGLEMAKKMQLSLLPWSKDYKEIEFNYIYKPCETLGGDFFYIHRIDDENIAFYIADVSGHGITASMLTVFLRSSIRKNSHSPAKTLKKLYKSFNNSDFNKELYITIFYCVYNTKKKELTYTNAGHNCPPIIIKDGNFQKLDAAGVPISSWVEKPSYKDKVIKLSSNDRIFLNTDGMANQWLSDIDKILEDKEFTELLKDDNKEIPLQLNTLYKYVQKQLDMKKQNLKDDITMALIKIL